LSIRKLFILPLEGIKNVNVVSPIIVFRYSITARSFTFISFTFISFIRYLNHCLKRHALAIRDNRTRTATKALTSNGTACSALAQIVMESALDTWLSYMITSSSPNILGSATWPGHNNNEWR
jgi:hypothetical protein